MKKKKTVFLTALITAGILVAGTAAVPLAFAKDDEGNKEHSRVEATVQMDGNVQEKVAKEVKAPEPSDSGTDSMEAGDTVTGSTYGDSGEKGHKGYNGLLKALQNLQGKPSENVVANLLSQKYDLEDIINQIKEQSVNAGTDTSANAGTDTTVQADATAGSTGTAPAMTKDELKAYAKQLHLELQQKLDTVKKKDTAFSDLADIYLASDDAEEAAAAQKEAISLNAQDLQLYKKLGTINKKLGKSGINAFVNGNELDFQNTQPIIKNGTTLVPYRAISEALKAEVTWNAEEQSVTVVKNGVTVKLIIGSNTAYVNGQEVQLDVAAELLHDHTLVPIRFLSTALQTNVQWEPDSKSVVVNEQP